MTIKTTIALLGALCAGAAQAAPSFVNGLTIPASTGDQFGTSVNDGRVGYFSDIYYDPNRSIYPDLLRTRRCGPLLGKRTYDLYLVASRVFDRPARVPWLDNRQLPIQIA